MTLTEANALSGLKFLPVPAHPCPNGKAVKIKRVLAGNWSASTTQVADTPTTSDLAMSHDDKPPRGPQLPHVSRHGARAGPVDLLAKLACQNKAQARTSISQFSASPPAGSQLNTEMGAPAVHISYCAAAVSKAPFSVVSNCLDSRKLPRSICPRRYNRTSVDVGVGAKTKLESDRLQGNRRVRSLVGHALVVLMIWPPWKLTSAILCHQNKTNGATPQTLQRGWP